MRSYSRGHGHRYNNYGYNYQPVSTGGVIMPLLMGAAIGAVIASSV